MKYSTVISFQTRRTKKTVCKREVSRTKDHSVIDTHPRPAGAWLLRACSRLRLPRTTGMSIELAVLDYQPSISGGVVTSISKSTPIGP